MESVVPYPFRLDRGSGLCMQLRLYVEAEEALLQLNRFLVGEGEDEMSPELRTRYLLLTQIPAIRLGYVRTTISPVEHHAECLVVSIGDLALISASMARDERRAVDFGLASAAASAVSLAAAAHRAVGLAGAVLTLEGSPAPRRIKDVLVMDVEWAKALGLKSEYETETHRFVPWRMVDAFDAQEALKAVHACGMARKPRD